MRPVSPTNDPADRCLGNSETVGNGLLGYSGAIKVSNLGRISLRQLGLVIAQSLETSSFLDHIGGVLRVGAPSKIVGRAICLVVVDVHYDRAPFRFRADKGQRNQAVKRKKLAGAFVAQYDVGSVRRAHPTRYSGFNGSFASFSAAPIHSEY